MIAIMLMSVGNTREELIARDTLKTVLALTCGSADMCYLGLGSQHPQVQDHSALVNNTLLALSFSRAQYLPLNVFILEIMSHHCKKNNWLSLSGTFGNTIPFQWWWLV